MSNSKEYNAKYYQEHKTELAEKKKARYRANRETILAKMKQYRDEHREEYNARAREYMRAWRRKRGEVLDKK
jgi:hypothetical protein